MLSNRMAYATLARPEYNTSPKKESTIIDLKFKSFPMHFLSCNSNSYFASFLCFEFL
jgi:hypothetical protein